MGKSTPQGLTPRMVWEDIGEDLGGSWRGSGRILARIWEDIGEDLGGYRMISEDPG